MNRFIVGGASDNIHNIPKALYKTGTVIGVNDWFLHDDLDIYLAIDGNAVLPKYHLHLRRLALQNIPVYLSRVMPQTAQQRLGADAMRNVHIFNREKSHYVVQPDEIRRKYNGKLIWLSTSCMAAIHLAICLGADEIVLAGFDFYGNKRWDGYTYKPSDLNFKPEQIRKGLHKQGWTSCAPFVNKLFSKFNQVPNLKIWKTRKESPLDCEYLDPNSDYALNPQ